MREIENEVLAKKINDGRIFEPKIEDPLDDVIEIIDVETADQIEKNQQKMTLLILRQNLTK